MDNGIYIVLSKQLALFRDMETTANNIANTNTTGFESRHMLFRSFLMPDSDNRKMAFTQDVSTYRNTQPGPMKSTGNSLDAAISGPGYFQVETPLGIRYTRAGNFQLDGNGTLTTQDGYPVLDANQQPITFLETDRDIVIGEGGNISVDGEERGNLGVVEFENDQLLEHASRTLFKTDAPARASENSRVLQGVLEDSNVQPVLEMTHMIDVSRSVSSTAKFIEVMYDLQRKASDTYAKPA